MTRTLRAIILFILLIATILFAGTILSYPIYLLFSLFSEVTLHKAVHYSIVLTALGLSIYYLKTNKETNKLYGLARQRNPFMQSFLFGAVILLTVELCLYVFGMRQIDPDLADGSGAFILTMIKALVSGLLVGIIEETTYRGASISGLKKYSDVVTAIIASSTLYAAVHFINFAEIPKQTNIKVFTSLQILGDGFYNFTDPLIIDSFITLFLLGTLLSLVRIHSNSLIPCIGLHAGIVTVNKIMSYSTDYKAGSPYDFLVNAYDRLNGWLASICLLVAIFIYYKFFINRTVKSDSSNS